MLEKRMTTGLLRRCTYLALALACLGSCGCLVPREGPVLSVRFEEAEGLAINPDCGWVAYNYEDSHALRSAAAGGQEPFPFASVIYTRHPRKAWEGPEGDFEGSEPLKLLEDWIAKGRHVGFRIYANGPEDLPADLREQVPTLSHAAEGGTKDEIVYWSEPYVEDHRKLVEFLGRRLGGSPYLAYVDVGAAGNSGGEWVFHPRRPFIAAGLDDGKHLELVTEFVEMYRRAFPQARLFISYDCVAKAWSQRREMVDLLRKHDVGIRDDGLGGWPFPEANPSRATWPVPGFWPEVPVLFEGGGEGGGVYGWTVQDKDPRQVLDWAFEHAHPSYVNVGGAESTSARACEELPALLREYGRRLGYRFVLLEATCPGTAGAGELLPLDTVWANRGVAPCYGDRSLELALVREDGEVAQTLLADPEPATSRWGPGQTVRVHAEFRLPEGLPPGGYSLRLGMLRNDPRAPGAHVAIATRGADAEGRFDLGVLQVQ